MAIVQLALLSLFAPVHTTQSAPDLAGFIFLYVGPDQMLPVMSALGAVIGVLLMMWHRVIGFLRKGLQSLTGKRAVKSEATQSPADTPQS